MDRRGGAPMTARLAVAAAILLVGALGAVALIRLGPTPEPVVPTPPRPEVRVVTVRLETVRVEVTSEGTVAPRNRITLQAAVSGRVEWVSDRLLAGARFAAGEPLVRLESEPYERARLRAASLAAQAALRLAGAEAAQRVAEAEWAGAEPPPDPLALRIPQVAEARAAAAAAESGVRQAERDLERTVISAPFDLRVVRRQAEVAQFAAPGTPLAEAYGTAVAEVRLPLAEADLAFLELPLRDAGTGPRVTLSAAFGGAEHSWEGRIVRMAAAIDPRTRLLDAIAEVRRPYGGGPDRPPLTPGMFVRARIEGREYPEVARIPRPAFRGGGQVLVVDGQDRLRFRTVSILRDRDEEVLVAAGLADGERVSITPLDIVTDGMAVTPAPAPG